MVSSSSCPPDRRPRTASPTGPGTRRASRARSRSPASEAEIQARGAGRRPGALRRDRPLVQPVSLTDGTLLRTGPDDRRHGHRLGDRPGDRAPGDAGRARSGRRSGTPGWRSRTRATSTRRASPEPSRRRPTARASGSRSFSATVRRMRLVTADGDVLELGEDDPRLPAAQVALGMLGVITEVELQAVPAYRLAERIEHWTWDEAWGRLDEMARAHRHYSFFWIPAEGSAELYGLTAPEGAAARRQLLRQDLRRGRRLRARLGRARPAGRPQLPDLPDDVRAELPRARVLRPVRPRRRGRRPRCAS